MPPVWHATTGWRLRVPVRAGVKRDSDNMTRCLNAETSTCWFGKGRFVAKRGRVWPVELVTQIVMVRLADVLCRQMQTGAASVDDLRGYVRNSAFHVGARVSLDAEIPGRRGEIRNDVGGSAGICDLNHLGEGIGRGPVINAKSRQVRQRTAVAVRGGYCPAHRGGAVGGIRHCDCEGIQRRGLIRIGNRDYDVRISADVRGIGGSGEGSGGGVE